MARINWKLVFEFVLTIFIPLLYLLNIDIAFQTPEFSNELLPLRFLGIVITIFGLIFWILSYINLGRSFGVLPQKQKEVTSGLYKYFSHPMYIGISATLIGFSLANASFKGLIFFDLLILPMLIIRSRFEEKNFPETIL
jgi:protein-S-isoprenylcysteine O-methyltransferase Ste14